MLKGKTAIVTGSTSGIGLGIARSLAHVGVDVTLNGIGDASEIERLRSELATETDTRVTCSAADMTKPEQIEQMVRDCEEQSGSVDILVNNAGMQLVISNRKADQTSSWLRWSIAHSAVAMRSVESSQCCTLLSAAYFVSVRKELNSSRWRQA